MPRKVAFLMALGVLGSTMGVLSTSPTFGQAVAVSPRGGVHVRAPFVRVDVYPFGGVSVRAPFAAVDVPGRRYYHEPGPVVMEGRMPGWAPAPLAIPTAQELAAMDDEDLLRLLRSTEGRLRDELGRFDTGARWQKYLRVSELDFADASVTPDDRREALAATVERFGRIASDPQYGMIAALPAFVATQAVMSEFLARLDRSANPAGAPAEELPPPDPSHGKMERSLLPRRAE